MEITSDKLLKQPRLENHFIIQKEHYYTCYTHFAHQELQTNQLSGYPKVKNRKQWNSSETH